MSETQTAAPRTSRGTAIGLLIAALLVAGILSYFASSSPDGLEKVALDQGFIDAATEHATGSGPLADYATSGVTNEWLSVGLSGVIGVLVVAVLAAGLFLVLRPRRKD